MKKTSGLTLESKLGMSLDELAEKTGKRRGGRFKKAKAGKELEETKGTSKPPKLKVATAIEKKKVYVENLNYKTSWQDLKDHMKAAGTVEHADLFTRKSGASKGCGWVEFSTEEEAEKALKTLNDSTLDGREITLKPFSEKPEKSRPRRERSRSRSPDPKIRRRQLFVGNLPFSMTWQQLKDVFNKYASVERADIVTRRDGTSKGFGYVLFDTPKEAKIAFNELKGAEIEGRRINIDWDDRGYKAAKQ